MKIEEIEQLCNEATPGPWEVSCVALENFRIVAPEDFDGFPGGDNRPDAEFIAASREIIPKLLAVAKAAKNVIDDPDLAFEDCHGSIGDLEKTLEDLEK